MKRKFSDRFPSLARALAVLAGVLLVTGGLVYLVDEALVQLSKQQVPHIVARAVRRNASAMKFFKRSGFDWVRTEEYLLGRDM